MTVINQSKKFDWQTFLKQWSREFIASANNLNEIPASAIKSGWLGYPGATEEQIAHVESRLQVSLPPSYREFLKVSNGWQQITPFIYRIWSVEQIDWFFSRRQNWMDTFISSQLNQQHNSYQNGRCHGSFNESCNGIVQFPRIPDSEYFLYGEAQDCSKIRYEYLQTALEISDKGESAIYLLNPKVTTSDGEWEAWFFGDWLPGADRYPSFRDMMEAEYINFLEMKDVL